MLIIMETILILIPFVLTNSILIVENTCMVKNNNPEENHTNGKDNKKDEVLDTLERTTQTTLILADCYHLHSIFI